MSLSEERLAEIREMQQANLSAGDAWPHMAVFRAVDDLLAHVDHLTAENARLRALIGDLTDPDPCSFDHHGGCQAHGYLSLEHGEACPQAEAKVLLNPPTEGENDADT